MTKRVCYNGYCEPIHKENEKDHSKMAATKSFISIAVIVFVITLIVAAIGGLLIELFTL